MTAIRKPGKINDNTTLIDYGYEGVARVAGVYLVEAEKTCLIDSGSKEGASRIIKTLEELGVFPPDYVVLTHSHFDHSQGIPIMRKRAKKEQKTFEVLASENGISLLEDQSFNKYFEPKKSFENIKDVSPLKEGDKIDLEGLTLKIFDIPGHSKDHIAILDEKNKNVFVGDAIGVKVGDNAFLSPVVPHTWNTDDYYASLDKLRQMDYESLCLANFGYIYDTEAKEILDESRDICDREWRILETAEEKGKLDNMDYIVDSFLTEFNPVIPEFKIEKFMTRFLLGSVNSVRKLMRKEPVAVGNIILEKTLKWHVLGYKIYKNLD